MGKVNATKYVREALHRWPDTRNNDRDCMLAVWYLQNPNYEKDFKRFFLNDAIHPETIRRTRQKLQQHGEYPASEEVDNMRFEKFKTMKDTAGRASVPEQMEGLPL